MTPLLAFVSLVVPGSATVVDIIEVEVAGKLLVAWRSNKVAIRPLLGVGEKFAGIGAEAYAVADSLLTPPPTRPLVDRNS